MKNILNVTLTVGLLFVTTALQAVVDIYVENIAFANDGYNFYTDATKTTELNFFEGTDTLTTSESYRFFRLSANTGHPFYISDDLANATNLTTGNGPTTDLNLGGDGSYTAGIGANQAVTLSFNSGFTVGSDKLYYYCTSHPGSMVAEFTVVPEPETMALIVGSVSLLIVMFRRRR
ncbi:MAG: Uncharacterised protein [Opitutia bacterium UBA7350]|nr:MAG: Uncharacterised protein [Opitutae bacterium UBA7350]